MKKLIGLLIAITLLGANVTTATAQDKQAAKKAKSDMTLEEKAEAATNQMNERLGLDQDQYDAIYEINLDAIKKKTEVATKQQEKNQAVVAVLTESQRGVYKELQTKGSADRQADPATVARKTTDKVVQELNLDKKKEKQIYELTLKNLEEKKQLDAKKAKLAKSGNASPENKKALKESYQKLEKGYTKSLSGILSTEQIQQLKASRKAANATSGEAPTPEERAASRADLLKKELSLSNAQHQQIYDLELAFMKFEKSSAEKNSDIRGQIEEVLTDEQKVIAKEYMKALKQKKRNRK